MADSTPAPQTESPPDSEWLVNQIAHALRNPIFAAMVQAEALVMRAAEDERIAGAAGLVHRQLKRLEADINEMLLYGRPPKLNPRKVQIGQVLEQIASRFRRGENSAPAEVELTLHGDVLEVATDPDAITIIVERLIHNAIEHTEEPHRVGVELEIRPGESLRLTVKDDGEGVSDTVRKKMFLPFYPQHSGRPGLGLSVVKKFGDALDATVTIDSEEGKGTTAIVTIPIKSSI